MANCSKSDLQIYKKINDLVNDYLVTPFEDELLYFLATHTDKNNKNITSFLEGLKSTYSISKCYRFARYLALGINKPFHLYEGKLSNLCNGDFPHAWIETDEFIYDVSFIGKWPKDIYYQLFNPVIEEEIDLNNDPKYLEYKSDCVEIHPQEESFFLKYIDWYTYMCYTMTPNPFIYINPSWYYYPQDYERKEKLDDRNFIQNEWKNQSNNSNDAIPEELLSEELEQFIEEQNYLKGKKPLISELIKFIINNHELYEEKKDKEFDLALWKKAIEQKYSGSFCLLISEIPRIIIKIKENQENKNINKL